MELYQLRYFEEIAKQKSYTKAAELLSVTQPTLSIAIKKLEAELDVPLFQKDGKVTTLTDAGRMLEPIFRSILADADLAIRAAKEFNRAATSRIRLGLPQVSCDDLVLAVKDTYQKNEGVSVNISQLRFEDVRTRLLDDALDVGIILRPDIDDEVDKRAAQSFEYYDYKTISCAAYVSKKHRLARYRFITPEMLSEEKLLISGTEEGISRVIINYMKEQLGGGYAPEKGDYIDPYMTLKIAESYGVAFFPDTIGIDESVLARVPMSPAPRLKFVVAWNRQKRLTRLQTGLIEFIKDFANN